MANPKRGTRRPQPHSAGRAQSSAGSVGKPKAQARMSSSGASNGATSAASVSTAKAAPAVKAREAAPTSAASARAGAVALGKAPARSASAGAAKPLTKGQAAPKRRYEQRPWWQGRVPIFGTLISVGLVVVLFIVVARGQSNGTPAQPVPATVLNEVTSVSPQVFSTVGTGSLQIPIKPVIDPSSLKGPNGHPEMLYIGAEYCPYCAAQRWSMVVALSRFGTFKNLHITRSAGGSEVYPNTPTFTFYQSSYTSQYIDFVPVETETNQSAGLAGGYTSLQSLTSQQQNILSTYDAAPYVAAESAGGIPFIDINNQYLTISSGYSPQLLTDLSWSDIAKALSDPTSATTIAIVGNANYLTGAICLATNNQPASVCTAAPIPSIESQIKQANP